MLSIASVLAVACSSQETIAEEEIPLPDREARRDTDETSPPPPKSTKGAETPPGDADNGGSSSGSPPGNASPTAIACEKPSTCGAETPLCCGELGLGEGTLPSCPILSLKGTCAATCATSLSAACPVTNKTRLCETGADCGTDAPSCCHIDSNGFKANICVPSFFAPLLEQNGTLCD